MRLSSLTNEKLAAFASDAREMGETAIAEKRPTIIGLSDALEELIDRRAADNSDMRSIEMEYAYIHASGVIESSLFSPPDPEDPEEYLEGWFDLKQCDPGVRTVDEEVGYLDSRGLIERDPEHPTWIAIRDESEATA